MCLGASDRGTEARRRRAASGGRRRHLQHLLYALADYALLGAKLLHVLQRRIMREKVTMYPIRRIGLGPGGTCLSPPPAASLAPLHLPQACGIIAPGRGQRNSRGHVHDGSTGLEISAQQASFLNVMNLICATCRPTSRGAGSCLAVPGGARNGIYQA